MGCVGSKPEESAAVKLCRERCSFLDSAVKERYAFAQAHLLYMQSLKRIGVSIRDFLEQDLDDDETPYAAVVADAPVVKKAVKIKKGDLSKKEVESSPDELPHHLHSNSGSHLNFETDSDEDDDEGSSESLHHHNHSHNHSRAHSGHPSGNYSGSPNLQPQRGYTLLNGDENEVLSYGGFGGGGGYGGGGYGGEGYGGYGGGGMQMNYMRKQPTQSVSYQQKPMSPEVMNMGQGSYFPRGYDSNAPSSSSYQQFGGYSGYGGGGAGQNGGYGGGGGAGQNGGYYGGGGMGEASGSKPPPPPPSPPRGSAWDFLNFFEGGYNERYYAAYTPSRNSVDVREAEGIPDLEEDSQHEVVKEVHGQQKFVGAGMAGAHGHGHGNRSGNHSKKNVVTEERKVSDREDMYQARPSATESEGMEYEVHVVDKKVVDSEKSEGVRARGGGRPMGVSEVVREIQAQFDRAADAGNELASMLEVGKHNYRSKLKGYRGKVSTKVLHAIKPSVSSHASTSSASEIGASSLTDIDEATDQNPGSLSATLHKLHIWEKKLYAEVKAEEKMREDHDRKRQKLKHLDEKGAESHKVEATRTLIRSLSTKIRIAIQIVDKISVTINNIRDEELWPQLNDLIHGFTRMWKCMLDCHHNQLLAIREARNLDTLVSRKKPSHSNLELTNQLVRDLCTWTYEFSSWVGTQRKFIKFLNSWLFKCLLYEPEDTPDGPAPFSPGRIGAPSIFIICHQWSQAFDRISEKEVVASMRGLTLCVRQFWEQDKSILRQSMDSTKALESKVRELDREDQKMQKELQSLDKKLIVAPGLLSLSDQAVYQSDTSNASLKNSLQLVFDSMERFTATSMKEYEEILQRIEEDKLTQQTARNS